MKGRDGIGKIPAYAVVANEIRRRILTGELKMGERLPSEAKLIATHGFSRSTIREAIRSLASEDLVRTTRGVTGGTFVAVPSVSLISAHVENGVARMAAADAVTVDQLMDVREITEVPATGFAAYLRSEHQLSEMRRCVAGADRTVSFEAHQEFHLAILRAANNPLLELMTAPVFRVLGNRFARERAKGQFWESSEHDHEQILTAIEERDSIRAMALMRRHLDRLGDAYKAMDLLETRDPAAATDASASSQ